MKTFWFDGQSAAAHGLVISGSGTYDAPERDVEMVSIPGRNGDLIIDNGRYKNVTVSYPASICGNFEANAAKARAWLASKAGYCRLEDDYDPEHFRLARFKGPLKFTPGFLNRTGECTINFDCKPQRFLKAGEVPIQVTNGMVIRNPTGFPAMPLIKMTGAGNCFLSIENSLGDLDILFRFAAEAEQVWFDLESADAYTFDVNGNRISRNIDLYWPNSDPVLAGGNTEFHWVEGVEGNEIIQVDIIPRWWTV